MRDSSSQTDVSQPLGRFAQHAKGYSRDGVVVVRNVLGEADLRLLEIAFEQRLRDPLTTAPLYPGNQEIVQSHGISIDEPAITRLIRDSPLADVAWSLFGNGSVWYWTEQAWLKQGPAAPRTPWHQDMSYVPFHGEQFVVLWIPLDDLDAAHALEVVRGSHRGTLYNGTVFAPGDDTAPLYAEHDMPRLPDIESERHKWDIVSADLRRGDLLAFHPACLHGGAPTSSGQRRRTMSFRFFGDDVVYRPLPAIRENDGAIVQRDRKDRLVPGMERLSRGDAVYLSAAYRRVRPWTDRL